jgi:DtxR family Mn-dependent transcriptional regulator
MPSLTVENYLKAALQIRQRTGAMWVSTGELASTLGVSPGTVTSMLKTLAEPRTEATDPRPALVHYKPYEGVRLTEAGEAIALRMLRRHRLIELFLVRTLDLTWDRVHEEAEHMEHAVSDFLVDRIDEFLGHPRWDPHGDPIPAADGAMRGRREDAMPLAQAAAGDHVRLVRDNNPEAGVVSFEVAGRVIPMAHATAQTLLVQPSSSVPSASGPPA